MNASVLSVFCLFVSNAFSAQTGPFYPSHRFPTDKSAHFGYQFHFLSSNEQFDEGGQAGDLTNGTAMTRLRHQIHAEYQPTREYNFGVILNFDTINVENGNGSRDGLSEFSDQYLFAEYRFEDQVGHSIGAGLVVKIPFYKNPSVRSITDAGKDLTPIFGDGQTDYTLYLTGEIWPDNDIRIRADLGYTLRSEGFSDEIPYMVDVSYATPRYQIGAFIHGQFSAGSGDASDEFSDLKNLMGGSHYVFAEEPNFTKGGLSAIFWLGAEWAVNGQLSMALRGKNALSFFEVGGGLTYRWHEVNAKAPAKIKEVDIDTELKPRKLDGELQEEDEEFF